MSRHVSSKFLFHFVTCPYEKILELEYFWEKENPFCAKIFTSILQILTVIKVIQKYENYSLYLEEISLFTIFNNV